MIKYIIDNEIKEEITKEDLVDILIEQFKDEDHLIDISELDFKHNATTVSFRRIRGIKDIHQDGHANTGDIEQYRHANNGDIYQGSHKNEGKIWQDGHANTGDIWQDERQRYITKPPK